MALTGLPFNLEDLLNLRSIESHRVEFKATWDERIRPAVMQTVCAFANDLLNLNGGYIVLGLEEVGGRPQFPPRGLDNLDLERVQQQIRGDGHKIQPNYFPVLFPADFQGKSILVIWAPGGDNRPYQAPDGDGRQPAYFVRQGPQTIAAKGEVLRQLMELAAKVPFDDRKNTIATVDALSATLVRRFLQDVGSDLVAPGQNIDPLAMYRSLRITTPINSHEVPRNIGLLFFTDDPDPHFPGARIEVVQFGDDAGGDLIEERIFRGPLDQQIKQTLQFLDGQGGTRIQKVRGQAEVERTVPYPYEAMEEAIVNAIYHRGYDGPPEPTKVYLYPDRMEVISYPGPVAGVQPVQLEAGHAGPVAPARNRRIGEFLKELRLAEGRGTGIPKILRRMRENGSPVPRFEFDNDRTFFRTTLPVHPRYQVVHSLREAAHLWAIGEKSQALAHLERTAEQQPGSGAIASQIIDYAFSGGVATGTQSGQRALSRFEHAANRSEVLQPYLMMARHLIDGKKSREAAELLRRMPPSNNFDETLEAAILKRRSGDHEGAHHLFAEAYSLNPDHPKVVHEFAQSKLSLAKSFGRTGTGRRGNSTLDIRRRLNREAVELLRRALALTDDPMRQAWCWFDLAGTLKWLREPKSEIEAAYLKARALAPYEPRFTEDYEHWKAQE